MHVHPHRYSYASENQARSYPLHIPLPALQSYKSSVEADVQALKDILAKSTPEDTSDAQVAEIKAAKDKLMESAQKLFTKMYEQAGAAGAGAAGGPTPEAGPAPEGFQGDDVVDGDYKEV